jgi:hypothetical protein
MNVVSFSLEYFRKQICLFIRLKIFSEWINYCL